MSRQSFNFSFFLFSYFAYAGTFSSFAGLFFTANGMSGSQVGILLSLIQVMRIFGPNLWGHVADQSRRRVWVLRLTVAASVAVFSLFFVAQGFWQFVAIMVLLNLFTSAQSPLCEALLLGELKGDVHGYGRIRLWGSIGFILAVMAAGYLLDWFTVQALPMVAGFMLLGVLVASLGLREGSGTTHAAPAGPLWDVLRQPGVPWFFLSAALMSATHMSLNVYLSLYLAHLGYSKPMIGAMWAVGVVVEVLFFYFQGPLFARFGARRVMLFAFACCLVRFPMLAAGASVLAVLVLAQVLHAATFAAHHSSAIATMQRWFSGPLQARGQALYISLAYGLGGTLGGFGLSLCWSKLGPSSIYYVAAALAGAGLLAARASFRRQA